MLLSAEIRLFWFHQEPQDLEDWFFSAAIHHRNPDGPEQRTDIYLPEPDQTELGVKTRGFNPGIELKGLVARPGETLQFASHEIPLELWTKWPSAALAFDPQRGIGIEKKRWSRKFDTSGHEPVDSSDPQRANGCNVEWTIVRPASGDPCWTFGFEAFGRLPAVENSLRSVVRLMNNRRPPAAPGAEILSYPAYLARVRT
ncbi:MAG TPA: hypothetical protein VFW44_01000 [Bryobacteraceae bacterium]|nr:hypothetical protein [Bryobacteraceae bacterium]